MPRNTSVADKSRFRTLMAEFRKAAAGNLDEDEQRLIERINESPDAPRIFAKAADNITAKRLLSLCVEAYELAKNFNRLMTEAKQVLDKRQRYERAIADVEQLLRESQSPLFDRLSAYTLPDPARIELENKGLASMKERLSARARIANETILRLGATRKSQGRTAAQTAAIGWIAEGVKRITERANSRLTADLAELILGCNVSLDRVDNAAETRKREWRLDLSL